MGHDRERALWYLRSEAGASQEKVASVARAADSDLFSEPARAAIAYAEAMTITGQRVSDEIFVRVRAHFSEAQAMELTAAVALGIEAPGSPVLK